MRELRQSEIENFGAPVTRDKQIFRFQVAVHNALFVCRGQSCGNLLRVIDRLTERQRSASHALGQCLAFQQFRYEIGSSQVGAHLENSEDVWVVQRSGRFGLLLKAEQAFGIERNQFGKYFDCNFPVEAAVTRAIDLTHTARAERREDFVLTDLCAGGQRHRAQL